MWVRKLCNSKFDPFCHSALTGDELISANAYLGSDHHVHELLPLAGVNKAKSQEKAL